jgi:hypothetical protein
MTCPFIFFVEIFHVSFWTEPCYFLWTGKHENSVDP